MISVRAITPASTFSRIVARSCDLLRCHHRPTPCGRCRRALSVRRPAMKRHSWRHRLRCDYSRLVATALVDLERAGHVHAVATPFSGGTCGVLPRKWTRNRTERVNIVLKSVVAAGEDRPITVILHHSGSHSERPGRPNTL